MHLYKECQIKCIHTVRQEILLKGTEHLRQLSKNQYYHFVSQTYAYKITQCKFGLNIALRICARKVQENIPFLCAFMMPKKGFSDVGLKAFTRFEYLSEICYILLKQYILLQCFILSKHLSTARYQVSCIMLTIDLRNYHYSAQCL